ncbi:MAG: kelch repeat-containing protein [Kofleriaceae bacterium]
MGRLVALLCVVLGACIEDRTVPCGDLVCPVDNVCVESKTCAYPEQIAACEGKADREACSALMFEAAACEQGICQPIVCGDGLRVGPEVCDDENQRSGDGCAADCLSNETCGNDAVDPLAGEDCDAGIAGLSNDGCSSVCTLEALTWRTREQQLPGERYQHVLAYDGETGQVLMFGGLALFAPLDKTWLYDGEHWRMRPSSTEPPGRSGASIARDEARRQLVMFGGQREELFDTTWLWDGVTWTSAMPPTSPSARRQAAMAYDPVHQEVVLFGGLASPAMLGDTWVWDGATWTQRTPAASPPAGAWVMAWDETTERIVLVEEAETLVPRAWTWDGATWTDAGTVPGAFAQPLQPQAVSAGARGVVVLGQFVSTLIYAKGAWSTAAGFPEPTQEHALAYDPVRDRVVLFGGRVSRFASPRAATYEWDGATWENTTPTIGTPNPTAALAYLPTRGATLAYDSSTWMWDGVLWDPLPAPHPPARNDSALARTREGALLFGGSAILAGVLGDTWEWNGAWTQRSAATSPPARRQHAMVYDEKRDRVILFGGFTNAASLDDTWAWDGTAWTEILTTTRPPARSGHALIYDPVHDRVIAYGGSANGTRFGDTWAFDGTDWTEVATIDTPPPRASTAGVFHPLRGTPIIIGGFLVSGATTDVLELDGARWRELAPVTAAPPYSNHALVYDALRAEILAYAGDGPGSANTLSALRIGSQVAPADACIDADTDADGLASCADPDCWARCTPLCPPATTCDPMAPRCGDGACSPLEDRRLCPSDCP